MVDGPEDAVEIHYPVEESPCHVPLKGPQEGVDAHDVRPGRPGYVGEELVTLKCKFSERETVISVAVHVV
jgi:hypothetical protein